MKETAATAKPSDAVAIISYDEPGIQATANAATCGGRTPMNQTVDGWLSKCLTPI
jgi:hypothetical protein